MLVHVAAGIQRTAAPAVFWIASGSTCGANALAECPEIQLVDTLKHEKFY